uniref:Muscular LMNA-interacting protein n=1 Tax=Callorhinchus milii TaxID=7868 RepID=A0A4W3JK86_CALMI
MQVSGKVPRELGKIAGSHRVDSAESTAEGTLVETLMDPLAIKTLDEELLAMKSEPLHIAEDMSTVGVLSTDIDGQGALGRCLKEKDVHTSSEQVTVQDGIFKAELVYLADSNESDGFSGSSGTQFRHSAAKLPFSSQSPGLVANRNFTPAKVLVGESKLPVLRLAEKKVDGPWQKSNTQSSTSCIPHNLTSAFATQPVTTMIENGQCSTADMRHVSVLSSFNKSSLCSTTTKPQKKYPSLPRSPLLISSQTSFLSSDSLPRDVNNKTLFPSSSSLTKSEPDSPIYPSSPLHFLSCNDLHSSAPWSPFPLPSSRSTTCSPNPEQSSLRSSGLRHSLRTFNNPCRTSTSSTTAKSRIVSSPPTQLSLLTSILRSGKLPPKPSKSPSHSRLLSPAASRSTIYSQASEKSSPTPITSPTLSSCPKARMHSPIPLKALQCSSGISESVPSVASRSLRSPVHTGPVEHFSFTSLPQRCENSSPKTAKTLPTISLKHQGHYSSPAKTASKPSSFICSNDLPSSSHSTSPTPRINSPTLGYFSPRCSSPFRSLSSTQRTTSPSPDSISDHLLSERSNPISPTTHYSSSDLSAVTRGSLSPTPSSPLPFHFARSHTTSPTSGQPVSGSSSTLISPSPVPVNSFSSRPSSRSGSLTPTPMNSSPILASLRSSSLPPTPPQINPRSSSLKRSSHSPVPPASSSPRSYSPPTQIHSRPNLALSASAQARATLSNPRVNALSPGPPQSPPPMSSSRLGSHTPVQSMSCSTENDTKKADPKYKIKSSYKTFAAIPTNTLLLEQKAVDEAVSEDFGESGECKTSERSQSEFLYEPESLRRQTDELCATIERVLEEPLPSRCSSSTPTSLQKFLDSEAQKPKSPVPRTSGRETKYTKPGVIRPVTIVHKVPVTPEKVEYCPNPFRQYLEETTDAEIREQLFPCSTILTTVSYPKSCHHMYQTVPCCPEMSQSVPLSLSPVTSLTSGSYIRFSPNIPSNYYMTSNLSRSVHSLYIKPRHSITTIHENEALGSKELVDVATRLNRELLETRGKEWKEKVLEQKVNNNQGTLVITEE